MGPDKDINYDDAEAWLRDCEVAGGGWGMPSSRKIWEQWSIGNLASGRLEAAFVQSGNRMWTGAVDASRVSYFLLLRAEFFVGSRTESPGFRVLGVRGSYPRRCVR